VPCSKQQSLRLEILMHLGSQQGKVRSRGCLTCNLREDAALASLRGISAVRIYMGKGSLKDHEVTNIHLPLCVSSNMHFCPVLVQEDEILEGGISLFTSTAHNCFSHNRYSGWPLFGGFWRSLERGQTLKDECF
jgi:hypothetical protein